MQARVRQLAFISVARGCSFASLAIGTLAIALASEPVLATKLAGYLSLSTCFVLLLRACLAPSRFYKTTEVWLMLRPAGRSELGEDRNEFAQDLIGSSLRFAYLHFARMFALLSLLSFSASLAVQLASS